MSSIITQAKSEFYKLDNCSCILFKNNKIIFKSFDSGIKPLVEAIDIMSGAIVADKIIGKAAALLCAYGEAKAVYGHIMSVAAQEIFVQNNIEYSYFESTEIINNRQGTDICPMEKLVLHIDSSKEAFDSISKLIGR